MKKYSSIKSGVVTDSTFVESFRIHLPADGVLRVCARTHVWREYYGLLGFSVKTSVLGYTSGRKKLFDVLKFSTKLDTCVSWTNPPRRSLRVPAPETCSERRNFEICREYNHSVLFEVSMPTELLPSSRAISVSYNKYKERCREAPWFFRACQRKLDDGKTTRQRNIMVSGINRPREAIFKCGSSVRSRADGDYYNLKRVKIG